VSDAVNTEAVAAEMPPDDSSRPSMLDEQSQLHIFMGWFRADAAHSRKWRSEAKEDFDFLAGDQWPDQDKAMLINQQRPVIVFNRILTFIKAVAGMEINGRHEISYIPRNTQETAVNEVLSAASKWMADNCDGEDEESDSFQKCMAVGMGWCEHRLSYEEEPQGLYIEESLDPLEMYWDCKSRKKNLSDARRMARVRKMPLGDAQRLFPDFTAEELDAKWVLGSEPTEPEKTLEERRIRTENVSLPDDSTEVTLVHMQWWEREDYHLVADPTSGQKIQLDTKQFRTLNERLAVIGFPKSMLQSVKMTKKVYKQAFIGSRVLVCESGPIPDRFSWTCVTGESHHNKGTWFGLVRTLRDPQMWANKWLSQGLHILNTTAKGGLLAETGAFEDQRQAEENYAKPEGIVWMAKGALSSQSGAKIQPKPGSGVPDGILELMQYAVDSLRTVSGINLEMIGQKDINQPGVLEAQRKQAGMTVLATMFDSLRRSRKQIGRIRLYYIQNFLSDGRLIRIAGQDGAKVIPLIRDTTLGEYDVIVDDTPTSPNQKQANWAIIISILPAFKDQLMQRPDILGLLLEYSPLPSKVVEALKTSMAQPQPMQQQMQQLEIQAKVAQINRDQSTAEMQNAKAGATQATALYDEAMARNMLTKSTNNLDAIKTMMDAQHTAAQINTEQATADNIRAKTQATHADAHRARVGALIDALTPIHHSDPDTGGPAQPEEPPMQGAKKARDGKWYVSDKARQGKYLRVDA
jgi:hypothetical protein